MLINWFTVVAQAINFLILVWLLKRFLYQPILNAIDARERGVAVQLAAAEAKTTEAQKERDDFQHKNEVFDQERAALLKKATDEAHAERQRLLDAARKDADALRAKRQEALQNERRNLGQELVRWTRTEVFAIARKTLADLAAASLEERMAAVFNQRLRALTGSAKEQLAAAIKTAPGPVRVRSAFDLPPPQHAAIQQALNETFSADIPIKFETAPELVSGVELAVNGRKLAWSIADYLATLEKSAGALIPDDASSESKSDAKSTPAAAESVVKPAAKRPSQNGVPPAALAPKADR